MKRNEGCLWATELLRSPSRAWREPEAAASVRLEEQSCRKLSEPKRRGPDGSWTFTRLLGKELDYQGGSAASLEDAKKVKHPWLLPSTSFQSASAPIVQTGRKSDAKPTGKCSLSGAGELVRGITKLEQRPFPPKPVLCPAPRSSLLSSILILSCYDPDEKLLYC